MFGVSREDDDGGNVGENGSYVVQERAEERHQLAAGHCKCARHGAPVLTAGHVT